MLIFQETIALKNGLNSLLIDFFINEKIIRIKYIYIYIYFLDSRKPQSRKAHFVGPGKEVKLRLSQALTRGARPDSNSRPAVQISNPLL
jgi:hypothetical protein